MGCCDEGSRVFVNAFKLNSDKVEELKRVLIETADYDSAQILSIIGGINTLRFLPKFLIKEDSSFGSVCIFTGDDGIANEIYGRLVELKIESNLKMSKS